MDAEQDARRADAERETTNAVMIAAPRAGPEINARDRRVSAVLAAWPLGKLEAIDMNELGIELGPDAAEQQFEAVDR